MGFIRNLFDKIKDKHAEDNESNPDYEKRLKEDFGLSYYKDRWECNALVLKIDDATASQLSEPNSCLFVLKNLSIITMNFSQICILVANEGTSIVCNTKPEPTRIMSNLGAKGVAELIIMVSNKGGKPPIIYRGTILLTLP